MHIASCTKFGYGPMVGEMGDWLGAIALEKIKHQTYISVEVKMDLFPGFEVRF